MMTVGELIDALGSFPRDWFVAVDGYETDFDEALYPRAISLRRKDPCVPYYLGKFSEHGGDEDSSPVISAVVIGR